MLLPPAGYFTRVQALLDQHDIPLISDEVITGLGRTGHWFGTGLYGLRPDILTLAKGITSGRPASRDPWQPSYYSTLTVCVSEKS